MRLDSGFLPAALRAAAAADVAETAVKHLANLPGFEWRLNFLGGWLSFDWKLPKLLSGIAAGVNVILLEPRACT